MELDKKALKKLFPNLSNELESSRHKVAINSVRTESQTGEKATSKRFVHYTPDVIDFVRRCDTVKQAEKIISYMEKRGEIKAQYAEKLRKQLSEKGVRSFGSKKGENYYFEHDEQ